jgi:phosphoglycerate dehydrogenase-like enzyme
MSKPTSLLVVLTSNEGHEFLPPPLFAELRTLLPEFRMLDPNDLDPATFARELAATNPDILLGCWMTPPLPNVIPSRLRYVCYLTGSLKKLVSRHHIERGLLVTNWGGSIARTVAEAALFHVLACLRNASYWAVTMHQPGIAAWKNGLTDARSLFCRPVGIHGFGPVARELVGLLKPWACPITVFAPDVTPELAGTYGVRIAASLEALFSGNEVLIELAPLIRETERIVSESLLRLIPAGGVFVNVGRGGVVDEPALLRVAREGKIAIGLDVFAQEPLSADSGFRSLPRVGLMPHVAGPTIDRYADAGAFAVKNLRAYVAGRPLEAVVTPEVYDCSS